MVNTGERTDKPLGRVINIIREIAEPDFVYLLSTTYQHQSQQSLFSTEWTSERKASAHILLVLIDDLQGLPEHEWQDRIEQRCKPVSNVLTIVMRTGRFAEWLEQGHRFADRIVRGLTPEYSCGTIDLSPTGAVSPDPKADEAHSMAGLNRSREFLAGAELYRLRKQNTMAAFMLHQAAEQALCTLIKTGTGWHTRTHNLERLLRFGSMVAPEIAEIFGSGEEQRRLLKLLQLAYSDSRYASDYRIQNSDLEDLTNSVRELQAIVTQAARHYINI